MEALSRRWWPVLLLLAAQPAVAQYPQLEGRLSDHTRQAAIPLLDSARTRGLPIEPLVNKILEGVAKGADDGRIVLALRTLLGALETARTALGTNTSAEEITAGAIALRAGASTTALQQIRAARPDQPLVVPLSVLSDLVARGVPPDTAAAVILDVARDRRTDRDFMIFRQRVEDDISHGVSPGAAAARWRNQARLAGGTGPVDMESAEPARPLSVQTYTGFSAWTFPLGTISSAVTSEAAVQGGQWTATGQGRVWVGREGMVDLDGTLAGTYRVPLGSHLTAGLQAEGGTLRSPFWTPSTHLLGAAELSYSPGRRNGIWVGARGSGLRSNSSWQTITSASAGAWMGRGSLQLKMFLTFTQVPVLSQLDSVRLPSDTLSQSGPGLGQGTGSRYSLSGTFQDLGLHLQWTRGPLRLETDGGVRLGGSSADGRSWGKLSGTLQLTDRVGLTGTAGRESRDFSRGLPAKQVFSLGFRLTPGGQHSSPIVPAAVPAPGFEVVSLRDELRRIRLHLPLAHQVEIAADFTDWEPVLMQPLDPGVWALDLRLPPGSYRCSIRIDGGRWRAPPGLAGIADDFGGEAGIVRLY